METPIDMLSVADIHRLSCEAARLTRFCVVLIVPTIWLAVSLFAQTTSQESGHRGHMARVPFVGCASDGQQGPQPAPKGKAKLVQMDARTAKRLAYYQTENSLGVLAPRGWYCLGMLGSSGSTLFVSPQPIKSAEIFSPPLRGLAGPAIQATFNISGTSGRFQVAQVIARVFPAHRAFVQSVIDEGTEPASDYPFGPFPGDKLILQSDRIVEFQTPPHSEGLGTISWLRANDSPITGVEILEDEELDLFSVAVRLPPDMTDLTSPIIQQIERDNAAALSKK
jgi:hypothetical protein